MTGRVANFCIILRRASRRADDVNDARLGGQSRQLHRNPGCCEIDDRLGVGKQRGSVVNQHDAQRLKAGKTASVLAEIRMGFSLQSARQHAVLGFANDTDKDAAHAARGSGYDDSDIAHGTILTGCTALRTFTL